MQGVIVYGLFEKFQFAFDLPIYKNILTDHYNRYYPLIYPKTAKLLIA